MNNLNQTHFDETITLQQIASDPQNCVFVSASAGSGKTKILTDRVLRLLLDGVNPNKILCLTFTKVAAFEMQNRIYKELSNWTILPDIELEKKIFDLTGKKLADSKIKYAKTLFNIILDDFEGIKINTIHSFCQNLMARFPIESEIKPNFEIIDSRIENKLLLEAKDKLLQKGLQNPELAKKIQIISANLNENSFLEIILELINNRTDLENGKEKLFGLKNLNELIFKILNVENESESSIKNLINKPDLDSENLRRLADFAQKSDKKTDLQNCQLILNYLNQPNQDNFNLYLTAFLTKENKPKKQVFTKNIIENFNQSQTIIFDEQERILKLIEKINSFHIANLTTILLEIADKMLDIYSQLKSQNNYLDYNDLIAKSSKLLNNKENSDWIKHKLDGAIEHILVDESQDTNNHQWQIIKAVSEDFFSGQTSNEKNRTIFVVGDDKQSIYNFQGADPKIFGEVCGYYSKQLQFIDKKIENISLNNSFRSFNNILDIVDKTFSDPKYKKAISPINLVKHNAIYTNNSGKVELWPIVNIPKEDSQNKDDFSWNLDFDPKKIHNSKEILAKIIAKKIKKWISEKRILKSQNRPIQPNDIMILLKNRTNNLGNLIIENLQKENITVSGSDKVELIKNIIVQDLLSLAKFLLLNEDDLNLATLLKSPLVGLSEDNLFNLCKVKNEQNICLWEALKYISYQPLDDTNFHAELSTPHSHGDSHDKSKIYYKFKPIIEFLEEIQEYHKENPFQIYKLFIHILEIKGKKNNIISNFGKESKEILNQFLNLCLDFQSKEIASLENFISALNNFNIDIKIDNNNQFNEVKITTIHSAKGLEANIVILADTAHDLRGKYGSNNDRILWLKNKDLKLPIWPAGKKNNLTDEIKNKELEVKNDEYLRLLYVAMTRAKEELYICGFGKNIDKECWYNIIKNNAFIDTKKTESNFKELVNLDYDFCQNNHILTIGDDQQNTNQIANQNQDKEEDFEIPDFFNKKAKKEFSQNIIYPSQEKSDDILKNYEKGNSKIIGNIIHKILEIFPEKLSKQGARGLNSPFLGGSGRTSVCEYGARGLITKYLNSNHYYLKPEEEKEIVRQVLNIFENEEFAFLFKENSKSEVPIIGKIDNELISGKIDRLIINEDEIIIIDYKSDKIEENDIENATVKYQKQLNFYQKMISKIYPDKKIKSAIIWTFLGKISYI